MSTLRTLTLGPARVRWQPSHLLISCVIFVVAFSGMVTALMIGDYHVPLGETLKVLFGASDAAMPNLVIWKWRMPRAVAALVIGMLLGIAGALTQNVTRNALASPDILGISTGASAMVVIMIIVAPSGAVFAWGAPVAALIGGLGVGICMWFLLWTQRADPFRIVLFGIILNALLQACIMFLMSRAELNDAALATFWLHGSLGSASWSGIRLAVVVLVLSLPMLVWANHALQVVVLGQSSCNALGRSFIGSQITMLLLAVVLVAVAVAAAGPIGFIAFVGPQIAQRLLRTSTPPLLASGVTAAALLSFADVVIQLLPTELPVGVLTSSVGGVFLIYLLISSQRKQTAR